MINIFPFSSIRTKIKGIKTACTCIIAQKMYAIALHEEIQIFL